MHKQQFLKLPVVCNRVALGRSSIYAKISKGEFPSPVHLSDNGRAVAWIEAEVDEWMERRVAESRGAK